MSIYVDKDKIEQLEKMKRKKEIKKLKEEVYNQERLLSLLTYELISIKKEKSTLIDNVTISKWFKLGFWSIDILNEFLENNWITLEEYNMIIN